MHQMKQKRLVTSLAECRRLFGTNAKTKVVQPGLVKSFAQDRVSPGRSRSITFIVGNNAVKQ
jgi:hypothetical protein